jgi:hypothetical protein
MQGQITGNELSVIVEMLFTIKYFIMFLPLPILLLLPFAHLPDRPRQGRALILLHPPLNLPAGQIPLLIPKHNKITKHPHIRLPFPSITSVLLQKYIRQPIILEDGVD